MFNKLYFSLCDLSFELPHKTCFENFSASVHDSDRIVLIGDNGSGKSTLMQVLMGVTLPTSGKVQLSEGIKIGYMPQKFEEDDHTTVWEAATQPVRHLLDKLDQLNKLDAEKYPEKYENLLEELVSEEAFSLESHLETILAQMELTEKKSKPYQTLSGGERMRLKVAKLLATDPDMILLDEPTNHLDAPTREWLLEFLHRWKGAAIIISHDLDLLENWPNKVWAIEGGRINTFNGSYTHFLHHCEVEREKKEQLRDELIQRKKVLTKKAQAEETRRARTSKNGRKKYANDPLLRKGQAERAEGTMGRSHIKRNGEEKSQILEEIRDLNEPRKVAPRFHYNKKQKYTFDLRVEDGTVSYGTNQILKEVQFTLTTGQKVAITGANGSGKTTFFKALLGSSEVSVQGEWDIPPTFLKHVGHLDQYHKNLDLNGTIIEHILNKRPDWSQEEIKRHLNAFLFYDRRTWQQEVKTLSEGEKMRLSLALLAADSPSILFLDEVSNHLDLTTKQHLIDVIKAYDGALVVNSHEKLFLQQLGIEEVYHVEESRLKIIAKK